MCHIFLHGCVGSVGMMQHDVLEVPKQTVYGLIQRNHYMHRLPPITFAFGLYDTDELVGVCTFGCPPSKDLCIGVCGRDFKNDVLELNRLFLVKNTKNLASYFVSRCLSKLPKPKIVVSYADTSANHHGYIYQATNFIYTGLSAKRKEVASEFHGRTVKWDAEKAVERPRKHRYVYFVGNKKQRRLLKENLKYPVKPYPKGDNENYKVGEIAPTQALLI